MRQHGDNGDNVVLILGENHFHNISAFTWPSWPNVIDIQPTATGPVLTEPSNYENYKNDSGAGCWRGSTFYKLIRLGTVSTLHWQSVLGGAGAGVTLEQLKCRSQTHCHHMLAAAALFLTLMKITPPWTHG